MRQFKKGSASRQTKRQQHKAQRRQQQVGRVRQRQQWRAVQARVSPRLPKAAPIAGPYLVRCFWEHFHLSALLHKVGVAVKHKGLPMATLMCILLLFGVLNARSVSDLSAKAAHDPLVQEVLAVDDFERKRLYRVLNKVTGEQYLAFWDEIIAELQRDPRTATRRNGVMSGDDTTIFKSGKAMPHISVVYKSSGQRFGLGYYLPSAHYADSDKHYPVGCDLHRPTPSQVQAAQDKRERKRLGLDLRKRADFVRWLQQQVQQDCAPQLVLLKGLHLCAPLVSQVEQCGLPWLGAAHPKRSYRVKSAENQRVSEGKPKHWLEKTYGESRWQRLADEGCRVLILGEADDASLGRVSLLLVEDMSDGERTLYLTRPAERETLLARVAMAWASQSSEPESTRLDVMVQLFARARRAGVQAETAVFDRWFYVPRFMRQILALGFQRVIIKTKANLTYGHRGADYTAAQLREQLRQRDYQTIRYQGQRVKLARRTVHQAGLGRVQLVFVTEFQAQRNRISQRYTLMCTDPNWSPAHVYRAHKLRWRIEECYRELRQNHALEQFHGRNLNAIIGHIVLSYLSYLCVALTRLLTPNLKDKTLGWIKRHVFGALVTVERIANDIYVGFTATFLRDIGLPSFCT